MDTKDVHNEPAEAEVEVPVVSDVWPTKIVLHTYPNQVNVNPAPMDWGNQDPQARGPVVVSRHKATMPRRNGMFLQCTWR
jgi:hypothetical protein